MRKLAAFIFILFFVAGCKFGELSPEEKQKVADMKQEIARLEQDIAQTEKEATPEATGLIPSLMQTRAEVDKMTVAILRQHIAAIESGSKVTAEIYAYMPDATLVKALEQELADAKAEYTLAKAEANRYAGGIIKLAAEAKAATTALTVASLDQKRLSAKYGLLLPALPSITAKAEPQPDPAPVAAPQEPKVEINDPGPFDFRKTRWGMSKEDVLNREQGTPMQNLENALAYTDNLLGNKVLLLYVFLDGKLWRAGYVLDDDQYSNKNAYVDAYHNIINSLKEKYGTPKNEKTYWSQNLYKGDTARRGMAYAIGHVTSFCEWDRKDDDIEASISGNEYKITVRILYSNKELAKENEARQKKSSDTKM